MIAVLLAALAGVGVSLLVGSRATTTAPRRRRHLDGRAAVEVGAAALGGLILGIALFGGPLPALALAACSATGPPAVRRSQAARRRAIAHEAWPRMIEEIRLGTSSLGRSVPQALFEAGTRAPIELRSAFEAAQREWLLTTDFGRTAHLLKAGLADPTADAALETLLVANELGGAGLDARLIALREDRLDDVQSRKDARAKQAGVRFARRFVLLVPLGMAVAGLQIGDGRDAYQTPSGQLAVLVAIAVVGACWWWAGRLLRLPDEDRVFTS